MIPESMYKWFTQSIIGIIVLGALGSIAGYYLLLLLRWTLKKLLIHLLEKSSVYFLKGYVVNKFLTQQLITEKNETLLIQLYLFALTDFAVTVLFFNLSVALLIIYFIVKGLLFSKTLIFLIANCFLSIIFVVRSAAHFFGIYEVSLGLRIKNVRTKIEKEGLSIIIKELINKK
jgi:hypothetical protein